jgi:hypothetical protein
VAVENDAKITAVYGKIHKIGPHARNIDSKAEKNTWRVFLYVPDCSFIVLKELCDLPRAWQLKVMQK